MEGGESAWKWKGYRFGVFPEGTVVGGIVCAAESGACVKRRERLRATPCCGVEVLRCVVVVGPPDRDVREPVVEHAPVVRAPSMITYSFAAQSILCASSSTLRPKQEKSIICI